jgi:hypothetical protein
MKNALQGPEKVLKIEVDLGGEQHKAVLIARVLDEEARIQRDRDLVRLAGDVTYDELPVASRLRLWALSTVRRAIVDRPAWFDAWIGRHDELLFSVFAEVDALERGYFRGYVAEGEGEEERVAFRVTASDIPTTP